MEETSHGSNEENEGGINRNPALDFAALSIRSISGSMIVADAKRPNDVLAFFADDKLSIVSRDSIVIVNRYHSCKIQRTFDLITLIVSIQICH